MFLAGPRYRERKGKLYVNCQVDQLVLLRKLQDTAWVVQNLIVRSGFMRWVVENRSTIFCLSVADVRMRKGTGSRTFIYENLINTSTNPGMSGRYISQSPFDGSGIKCILLNSNQCKKR